MTKECSILEFDVLTRCCWRSESSRIWLCGRQWIFSDVSRYFITLIITFLQSEHIVIF